MNAREAADLLTNAITSTAGLAEITTAPTPEQADALTSVARNNIAPREVCNAMDLEQGSTWGVVVEAVLGDVEGLQRPIGGQHYEIDAKLLVKAGSDEDAWRIARDIASNLNGEPVSSNRPGQAMLVFTKNGLRGVTEDAFGEALVVLLEDVLEEGSPK